MTVLILRLLAFFLLIPLFIFSLLLFFLFTLLLILPCSMYTAAQPTPVR